MDEFYDVIVVGGGAAGLSAALALGRARRSVLVVDAGEPRNAPAGHVHNYLGREGTPPGELLAIGREEVAAYGVQVVAETVTVAATTDGDAIGVEVRTAAGAVVRARRLLVTTGLVDDLPTVPGVAERWGRDVLHCPYCHGWEVRDGRIGVLASGPLSVHQALLFRQWTSRLTFLTHTAPVPDDASMEQLAARGIPVVPGEVEQVLVEQDRLTGVRLSSREVVALDALVVAPVFRARADVLSGLGVHAVPMEMGGQLLGTYVPAEPSGATAVPGVWVAGNVSDLRGQVITSAAAGLTTAANLNADLVAEDTTMAVAAHRARLGVPL